VGTFNFSAKYLSKKDSSTMLPELTEFVPATRMDILNDFNDILILMWGRNGKKMHIIFFIYIFLFRGKRGGQCIKFGFFNSHSQKSWVILPMNIHKPNRIMYDVSK
jgi:hypothetical protein